MPRWARWHAVRNIFVHAHLKRSTFERIQSSGWRYIISVLVRLSFVQTRHWTLCSLSHCCVFLQCLAFTLAHNTASVFQKSLWLDVIRFYYHACQYTTVEYCFDLAPRISKSIGHPYARIRTSSFSNSWALQYMRSLIVSCQSIFGVWHNSALSDILWAHRSRRCSHAMYSSLIYS